MKKKILLFLLIVTLFTITGCNKDKESVDNTLVKVNDVALHMDKEKEFKGIKYIITDDLKEAVFDKYVQYYLYQEAGSNLLFFRIFYYENKNHNDIRNDLGIANKLSEEKGKTGNIEYTFIDEKRNDGTIHFYIIDKDNISYVINFVSKYDIKDFEEKVLNSIKF